MAPMKGMITSYLASPQGRKMVQDYLSSPQGQEMIQNYLSSPEGQKAICEFVATKKGRQTMKHVLPCILSTMCMPADLQMAVAVELRGIP